MTTAVADVTDMTDEGIDADANGSDDAAGGGRDREPYKIPGHSHWFRWDATHELERRGVPEFFEGRSETKTPEAYSKIRAAMMNQYRAAKKAGERLSFTKARRGLVGDVNSLQRVFDFLERWGLINWQPRIDAEKAAGLGANVRVVAVDVARPEKPGPRDVQRRERGVVFLFSGSVPPRSTARLRRWRRLKPRLKPPNSPRNRRCPARPPAHQPPAGSNPRRQPRCGRRSRRTRCCTETRVTSSARAWDATRT